MEEERLLESVDCFVGKVQEPSVLSALIRNINSLFPLEDFGLGHLKRVKRQKDQFSILICPTQKSSLEQVKELQLEIYTVPVSKWPAVTKEQYTQWNSLWPMTFHEGQSLPKDLCTEQHQKMVQIFLDLFPHKSTSAQNEAFIRDDESGKIHSACTDTSHTPLGHASLLAIDKVAAEEQILKQGYLCTGKSLFIRREPCVMCSMALVHSRIERVFFEEANLEAGGLTSRTKIGYLKSLNHHFTAFQFLRE